MGRGPQGPLASSLKQLHINLIATAHKPYNTEIVRIYCYNFRVIRFIGLGGPLGVSLVSLMNNPALGVGLWVRIVICRPKPDRLHTD